jgi:hypothetical protein
MFCGRGALARTPAGPLRIEGQGAEGRFLFTLAGKPFALDPLQRAPSQPLQQPVRSAPAAGRMPSGAPQS